MTVELISLDRSIGSDKIMAKARRRRQLGIEGGVATKVRNYLRAFGLDDAVEISRRLRVSPGMIRLMLQRPDVRAVLRRRNDKPRPR
jgi:hypothetical protein